MRIYTDGSGWNGVKSEIAIFDDRGGAKKTLKSKLTNNEAEYLATIWALIEIPDGGEVLVDSALVEGQLERGWKVKAPNLIPLAKAAYTIKTIKNVTIRKIPRKENLAGKFIEKTRR